MSRGKQIEERLDLSDTIDYAMRDWDDYIDECQEEGIPPIDTFEEYIADYVLRAGYHKQEWISVEERLPEECTHVIVHDEDGTVGEAFHSISDHFEWVANEKIAFVTHWMPLPSLPEKEKNDD